VLLAFDTATPAVTVALVDDSGEVRAEHTVVDARRHGELLAPGIARVLADGGLPASGLTAIGVGVGPGPFTGLRVGLMTARSLGDALDIPVHGVCTLDVLAADVIADAEFVVATDARRREVYWAAYDAKGARVDGPHVGAAAGIGWSGAAFGAGALLYPDAFGSAHRPDHPRAGTLGRLVVRADVDILPADPLYLRRPDAVEPGARKAVTPA